MKNTPRLKHFITYLAANPDVNVTEHLRYMGAIRVFQAVEHPSFLEPEVKTQFILCSGEALITVECPDRNSQSNQYDWSRMHMDRLNSFALPAVWWTRKPSGVVQIRTKTDATEECYTNRLAEDLTRC